MISPDRRGPVEAWFHNRKIAGSIPNQDTYLGCLDPRPPVLQEATDRCFSVTLLFISLPLSLPLSLKSNEKISLSEDKKKLKRGSIMTPIFLVDSGKLR